MPPLLLLTSGPLLGPNGGACPPPPPEGDHQDWVSSSGRRGTDITPSVKRRHREPWHGGRGATVTPPLGMHQREQ